MIDLSTETLLSLSKAARQYPGGGKHVSAIHRYRLDQKTPLECVMVGGRWMTSLEAMNRHVYALTAAARGPSKATNAVSSSNRERIAQARRELAAAGI